MTTLNSKYRIKVARHGILVPSAEDSDSDICLPPCRANDHNLGQPPLALDFNDRVLRTLLEDALHPLSSYSFTDFGPVETQDKPSNQDFSLSATISIGSEPAESFQFLVISDGVSRKTFWAERTSRISALVAWAAVRIHLEEAPDFSDSGISRLQDSITSKIRQALESDRLWLSSSDNAVIPAGWDESLYREMSTRKELWYNATLLVAVLGANGGCVLACGDGGVVVRKFSENRWKSSVLVSSTEDLSVSGVVSLADGSFQFTRARITASNDSKFMVFLSSDGVDRTLRMRQPNFELDADPYGSYFEEAANGLDLKMRWNAIYEENVIRENDNVSMAVSIWPPKSSLIVAAAEPISDQISFQVPVFGAKTLREHLADLGPSTVSSGSETAPFTVDETSRVNDGGRASFSELRFPKQSKFESYSRPNFSKFNDLSSRGPLQIDEQYRAIRHIVFILKNIVHAAPPDWLIDIFQSRTRFPHDIYKILLCFSLSYRDSEEPRGIDRFFYAYELHIDSILRSIFPDHKRDRITSISAISTAFSLDPALYLKIGRLIHGSSSNNYASLTKSIEYFKISSGYYKRK